MNVVVLLLVLTISCTVLAFTPPSARTVTSRCFGEPKRPSSSDGRFTTSSSSESSETASSEDIMDWFLLKPASPIFQAMVNKMSPEVWDPLKYQLDSVPVFYCGVENVPPKDLPFRCFLDVDDAKEELRSRTRGRSIDAKLEDLLPMTLGDAYTNVAMRWSTIVPSAKDLRFASIVKETIDDDDDDVEAEQNYVPVFGVKVRQRLDGELVTGLTDRLYFDGEQAREVLEAIVKEQSAEEEEEVEYELFVVSLNKALEYLVLDKESDFKFEFVPPQSSLEYISTKYNVE